MVERSSPHLHQQSDVWFTPCGRLVSLDEDSHFEICLDNTKGGGNTGQKLVYDKVNNYFKVLANGEQLKEEYHLVTFEAQVYMNECTEDGEKIMLTIRHRTDHPNGLPELQKFLLVVDREVRFIREGKHNAQHFGRVHMESHLQTLEDLEHVQLQMICH